jgi:hypothetical protein
MIGPDGYQFDGEGESDWEFLTAEPYGYKRFGKDVTAPAVRWFKRDGEPETPALVDPSFSCKKEPYEN